jgi:hypothetical protein
MGVATVAYKRTAAYGGPGGNAFADDLTRAVRMAGFVIRHDQLVDGIMGLYKDANGYTFEGPWHGGQGGHVTYVTFDDDEYLTRVDIKYATLVDHMVFHTNKRRYPAVGYYGGPGGDYEVQTIAQRLVGFYGRGDKYLDQIGFFEPVGSQHAWIEQKGGGGSGGNPFSTNLTEVARLEKVRVTYGNYVDSLHFTYRTVSGDVFTASYGGSKADHQKEFTLAPDEVIASVDVRADKFVDRLTFRTNKGQVCECGGTGGKQMPSISGNIVGFFGRADLYIDQIGFLIAPAQVRTTANGATALGEVAVTSEPE